MLADMIVPDEHREAHDRGLARVRKTGVSRLAGKRLQLPARDRTGRSFPIELTLQVTEGPGGTLFHAFLHDISARRAAERQLHRQADLIDAAPVAIIVRDLDGTTRSWNRGAEDTYGWSASEAVGRIIHELLDTEFPTSLADVEHALATDGHRTGELVHRRADGTVLAELSRQSVRTDPGGGAPPR